MVSSSETIRAPQWLQDFCESNSVILGSGSEWRRKVLDSAGCRTVDTMSPDIDEKAIRHEDPETLVLQISNAKADALMKQLAGTTDEHTYLICTDQVAVCGGVIREKPESIIQAREFIKSYSADQLPVETCSGVVVVHVDSGKRTEGTFWNKVFFKKMPQEIIDEIVNGRIVYTCCGGFSVDCDVMGKWVDRIEGGVDGVMGMPLGLLQALFKEHVERGEF